MLLEVRRQQVVDDRLDRALRLRVAEFRLGLSLELRLVDLDRQHRRQSFPHVVAGKLRLLVLLRE